MRDVVLVTADSVRRDFVDAMPFVDSHQVSTGIAAGHYTRPSLAALQSSRISAAVQSKAIGPTLAEVLERGGYTTIGLVPTAQADPAFGFDAGFDSYDNFMSGGGNPAENRRSGFRELLGSFDIVRQVYRRVYPMEANMADLPDDGTVVDEAIERFNAADAPRFLWVHQMGSHRPYGTGNEAIPSDLDRKAEAAGGRHWFGDSEVTEDERDRILGYYRDALGRVDDRIERLLSSLDSDDPVFCFTSDHGDEFGEEGYYYHQGYRRRVADTIIRVPVVLDGIETVKSGDGATNASGTGNAKGSAGGGRDGSEGEDSDGFSLLDIAPTLVSGVGLDAPEEWHGTDRTMGTTEQTLTVAPWHDRATVAWQDFDRKLVARDADVSVVEGDERVDVESADVSAAVEKQLQDLGYTDAG